MKSFVIIKTGPTFPNIRQRFGDFEDWMIDGCGLFGEEIPEILLNPIMRFVWAAAPGVCCSFIPILIDAVAYSIMP
ncbi:MAG: hypothetical protein ACU84H_10175 [Gammaproteobacteria bacterium]